MDAFLSRVRNLLKDRAFILSASLSVVVIVLFMFTTVYLMVLDKLNVTKIADMSVVSINDPIVRDINTNPLSADRNR
jgi:hypothetical protein